MRISKTWIPIILLFCLITGVLCSCNKMIQSSENERKDSVNISMIKTKIANSNISLSENEIPLASNTIMISKKTVRFIGRNYFDVNAMAYGFSNSNAGVTFTFAGSSLEVYLSSVSYTKFTYNYVCVYIDDCDPVVLCVDHEGWQTVTTGLDKNVQHVVRILKRSEANVGAYLLHKIRISENGHLFKPEEPKTNRRIQVLGDSITCGYGTAWDQSKSEEITKWEDGTNTYATMTADYFGASLENISISGIGVGNNHNEPYPLLPHYKKQDNFVNIDCDFTQFVPDIIVIALGTNDVGQKNDYNEFIENAVELVHFIRKQYPGAQIVWMYGAMGAPSYASTIQGAIDKLKTEGETRLSFLKTTPPTQEEGYGLYGHPSLAAHKRMAKELIEYISDLTDWKKA